MHEQPLSLVLLLGQLLTSSWTGHGINCTWVDSFSLASLSCLCASGEIVAAPSAKSRVCSVPGRGSVSAPAGVAGTEDEPSLDARGSCGPSRIRACTPNTSVRADVTPLLHQCQGRCFRRVSCPQDIGTASACAEIGPLLTTGRGKQVSKARPASGAPKARHTRVRLRAAHAVSLVPNRTVLRK